MTERLYLDHNATTPMKPGARDAMLDVMESPSNPSSVHKYGREARRVIEDAREQVARLLNTGTEGIVFTSGATEANNQALRCAPVERVLVSAIEHPSVLKAREDAEIIPVDENGIVKIDELDKMLAADDRPALVSVMLVNNETGVIQDVTAVVEIAKKHGALVHTDAVQAMGRIPVDAEELGADLLSISAHKIGGPQGVGALIIPSCAHEACLNIAPLLRGGGQEKYRRAGTENTAGIAGFGKAAELAGQDMKDYQKLSALRDRIESEMTGTDPRVVIYGTGAQRVANTTLAALPGVPSETQMIALDLAGVAVSNGSACSSGSVRPSHVLQAMGVSEDTAGSTLRISLGWTTTEKDVENFLQVWKTMYERVKSRLTDAA